MARWRADATDGLHGRVVEIGFGSAVAFAVIPLAFASFTFGASALRGGYANRALTTLLT
jgi:hypothetical protein